MDGGWDERIAWIIDMVAAAILGGAVGACLLLLGQPRAAVLAASVAGVTALTALRQVRPEPRRYRVVKFDLSPVPVVNKADEVLLLTEVAPEEPLELVDRLQEPEEDSRVVQLFAARPMPTPGELARRIDTHLAASDGGRGGAVLDLEVDAAAALRHALGELRASLG